MTKYGNSGRRRRGVISRVVGYIMIDVIIPFVLKRIQHRIIKNGTEVAAIITVDGAWMDVVQRKLTVPPDTVKHVFEKMPKAEQFVWD